MFAKSVDKTGNIQCLVGKVSFDTDKLVENAKVKISYTGKFFQDGSEIFTQLYVYVAFFFEFV